MRSRKSAALPFFNQGIIMQSLLRPFAAIVMALSIASAANAHDYKVGTLSIAHPHARATVPNQPAGAAYMTIENKGTDADKLVGGTTPIARSVQLHSMSMEGNVMKMREVASLEIKPSEKLMLQPGNGYHIMLIGLKQPLKPGDKFPMTLNFEKSGPVDVSVHVEDKAGKEKQKDAASTHRH
jgi:copper(I)-binding protein